MQLKTVGVAIALLLSASALSACSSSDAPLQPEAGPATPTSKVKPADCTTDGLAGAANQAAQAMGRDNIYTIDAVKCADDDWAVTSGLLASQDNPAMGAPTTFVFQRDGEGWAARDKAKVCGTNPTTTPAPVDADIPADLYEIGCLT